MFSMLRNRFGAPGVISVMALVFAMLGGAYAATDNAGSGAVASKQGKQGKRGKPGKPGPAGPTGPAGATGPKGDAGLKGDTGAKGDKGDTGEDGQDGSPWTAGGTLPPGATETGSWGGSFNGEGFMVSTVDFPIPLAADIEGTEVKSIALGGAVPPECENAAHAGAAGPANPEAKPGYLCVYTTVDTTGPPAQPAIVVKATPAETPGASKTGAVALKVGGEESAFYWGVFAVTGCGTGFACP